MAAIISPHINGMLLSEAKLTTTH